MKLKKIVLFAILICFVLTCKKDDEEVKPKSNLYALFGLNFVNSIDTLSSIELNRTIAIADFSLVSNFLGSAEINPSAYTTFGTDILVKDFEPWGDGYKYYGKDYQGWVKNGVFSFHDESSNIYGINADMSGMVIKFKYEIDTISLSSDITVYWEGDPYLIGDNIGVEIKKDIFNQLSYPLNDPGSDHITISAQAIAIADLVPGKYTISLIRHQRLYPEMYYFKGVTQVLNYKTSRPVVIIE